MFALSALVATTSIFRVVPFVASVIVHASVAAGLLVAAAHPPAGTTLVEGVDVDVVPELPTPEDPPAARVEKPVANNVVGQVTHTHPFPVDRAHDARPHDPSRSHDPPPAKDSLPHDPPAPAAPAMKSEGVLARFTIPSGTPTAATVLPTTGASGGTGAAWAPGEAPPSHDVAVPTSTVQVAAKLVRSVTAAYPVDARADEFEGDVQLEIVVDREGRVVDARVVRPAGHGFDEAALQAIRSYRFLPAQREGRAVRVRMPWSVHFRLR